MSEPAIKITPETDDRWTVEVCAGKTTSHSVTIPWDYPEKLGLAQVTPERLLEESFRFLLEREPNTAILRRFSLPVIASYFPDYESEIGKRLR